MFQAVIARSARPVLISGPVEDRSRPVLDWSLFPYIISQYDQISMLKMIPYGSNIGWTKSKNLMPIFITTNAAKWALFIMSTLKLNCNLGNFGGPVQGPVPKLGPVLVLGPQDRSGPDRLQTLATLYCACIPQCWIWCSWLKPDCVFIMRPSLP